MDFPNSRSLLTDVERNIENGSDECYEERISVMEKNWEDNFATVVTYLSGINLSQYIELFYNNGVNNEILFTLTEGDLLDIGMEDENDRKKFLNTITSRGRHRRKYGQCVSCSLEDITTVLTNTLKHTLVIRAALTSTRMRLEKCDNHNSLLTDYLTSANALALLCSEADIQAKLLNNQLNAILTSKPVESKNSRRKIISGLLCSVTATIVAVVYLLRRH